MKRARKQPQYCSDCRHPRSSFDQHLGFCTWQLDHDQLCGHVCRWEKKDRVDAEVKEKE